jgi:hypothetical protein
MIGDTQADSLTTIIEMIASGHYAFLLLKVV